MRETIFALSSGYNKSGVAVFRVSGPESLNIARILCQAEEIPPRKFILRKIYYPSNTKLIDIAGIIYFNKPHSFTGEEVVEIHTHGSIAIYKMLSAAILSTKLARMAEPGEFSKRAFLEGKLDLTSAEGIADLIDAETEMQAVQASRQMDGALEKLYGAWKHDIISIMALFEAYIDFPDEDIPESVLKDAEQTVSNLKEKISKHLNDGARGERLKNGINLAILGETNVGKSSLINYLTGREVAIVADIHGTTRDIIETYLDFKGYPLNIADTAGIRASEDLIEQEGIKRALQKAKNADIKIIMINAENAQIAEELTSFIDDNTIIVVNKIDLNNKGLTGNLFSCKDIVNISLKEKTGLEEFQKILLSKVEKLAEITESPAITRERHRNAIQNALETIENIDLANDLVLVVEDMRMAARHLSLVTGKIHLDEILDEIFMNFCIGK